MTYLFGIEVKYFGSVRAGDCHEAHRVHFPLRDASLPDDTHALLHTAEALRDLGEVVSARRPLLRGERAVVAGAALKVIAGKTRRRNVTPLIWNTIGTKVPNVSITDVCLCLSCITCLDKY